MSSDDMSAEQSCVRCGGDTPPDSLWGLCHKCLFDEAVAMPQPDDLLASGKRFGEYELRTQLGRGGMGVVYEAVHVALRRPVALKMILDSQSGSPAAHRRFHMEAESAARLDHPNIVPIYDIGEHDGHCYLTMKRIAGQTLSEKIRSGELCLQPKTNATSRSDLRQRTVSIVRLMATIARAVGHAHEKAVLHRDLKPSNILVDAEGQPHLTDFGLAKILERENGEAPGAISGDGSVIGTPNYMSPEQAAGRPVTHASDIYSLGAIFYEMLTGRPPFKASTVMDTLRAVMEQSAVRPSVRNSRVEPDLDTICLKCLEKSPAARYESAQALAEDLERWLRHEPIRARPVSLPVRARRWVRRNRNASLVMASLFLGLVAAIASLLVARERQARLELINANNLQMFNEEVERLWAETNRPHLHVHAARLAQMVNADLRPVTPDAIRLTHAAVISGNPYGQAMNYAPVLALVQKRMEQILGKPVFIDLRLYKFDGDGSRAPVSTGEVDFQRLGPLRYVQARQAQPQLELVVSEIQPKQGVIFARKSAGISNLTQVAGRRVAFAGTNATISFLTKVALAREGLTVRDLAVASNLTFRPWPTESPSNKRASSEDTESDTYAHREVMRQVLENTYDVGEGPRRHFELNKHRKGGLVELASFPVIQDVIVARAGLPAEVIDAFRQSLVLLKSENERALLLRMKSDLEGFSKASDADYAPLRAMMEEVRRFDTGSSNASVAAELTTSKR
jgi:serine/threonine protein kinase/ABC-type phosphate/phosphonate transport system substrate-binding protein